MYSMRRALFSNGLAFATPTGVLACSDQEHISQWCKQIFSSAKFVYYKVHSI